MIATPRRTWIIGAILLVLGAGWLAQPDAQHAAPNRQGHPIQRAAAYLWSKQSPDGGWHSETYGLLRSGQALTPFVLYALLQVPEEVVARPAGGVQRGLEFLRRHLRDDGALGYADPDVLEYPNYATAYALLCFLHASKPEDRARIERMADYLAAQQYSVEDGFSPDHPAYGGWGFGGARSPAEPGHLDLAHTRRVLQALAAADRLSAKASARAERFLLLLQKHPLRPEAGARAERFRLPLQKHPHESRPQPLPSEAEPSRARFDGGFYFSPVVLAANKGRLDAEGNWRSYTSATSDGVLALLAAGVARDDPRVRRAGEFLRQHPRLDYPQGIPAPPEHPEPWGEAIHFYHLAVRAEAYDRVDGPKGWRAQIAQLLASEQQPDGSFVNRASPLMKEDDPLLATALAVTALRFATAD